MSDEISSPDCKAAWLHGPGRTSRSTCLRGRRKGAEGSERKASRCARDQRLKLTLKSFFRRQPVQAGEISFLLFWQHVALTDPWSHQLKEPIDLVQPSLLVPTNYCSALRFLLCLDRTVTQLLKYLILTQIGARLFNSSLFNRSHNGSTLIWVLFYNNGLGTASNPIFSEGWPEQLMLHTIQPDILDLPE